MIALLSVGLLAAVGLWRSRAGLQPSRALGGVTLAGLAVSTALLGWTAYLGGPIRHDEIRSGTTASAAEAGAGAGADQETEKGTDDD